MSLEERLIQVMGAARLREYPHKPGGVFASDEEWVPARVSTPLFYGSFDWHSAVHTHWALARLQREVLDGVFSPDKVAAEVAYLEREPNRGFEVPYGMAWLLMLCDEMALHELAPLQQAAIDRVGSWLHRLPRPVRNGEHTQSAFSMGLAYDAAPPLREIIARKAREFYQEDVDGPIRYEPSAYDFLSPCLAEADLMRRILPHKEWRQWLRRFLPRVHLEPVITADRSDGKLAHFDGLNLSRAWMLRSIGTALGEPSLLILAEAHAEEGLKGIWSDRFEVTHWLGSFAVYWLTQPS